MKIIKPPWLGDGCPIISIDIHPDGSRFAIGGQSNNCGYGKIQIYNMEPILDPIKDRDKKTPRLLCALFNHMACVNCVRWGVNGKYLASGADDRLIIIWGFGGKTVKGKP